ncbi:hypothetical protein LQW54_012297 [Pestalotiopsis sp. IQ-011]
MGYSRIQDLRSKKTGSRDRHTLEQQRQRVQERSRASILRGWHEPSWRRHRVVRQQQQQPNSNSSNAAAPAKDDAVRVLRPSAAVAAPVSRAAAAKASRVAAARDSLAAAINAANAVRAPRPAAGNAIFAAAVAYANAVHAPVTDAVNAAPASRRPVAAPTSRPVCAPASRPAAAPAFRPAAANATLATAITAANGILAPVRDLANAAPAPRPVAAPAPRWVGLRQGACGVMKPDGTRCQGDIVCRDHTYAQRCAVPNRGGKLPPEGDIIRRYHLETRKERWEKAKKQKKDAKKK